MAESDRSTTVRWFLLGVGLVGALWLGAWLVDTALLGRDRTGRDLVLDLPTSLEVDQSAANMTTDEVRSTLDRVGQFYDQQVISVVVDDETTEIGFPAAGILFDADATLASILDAETTGLVGWTRSLNRTRSIPLVFTFDEELAADTLSEAIPDGGIPVEPIVADVRGELQVVPGVPGRTFDVEGALLALAADRADLAPTIVVDSRDVPPTISDRVMQEFVDDINRRTSDGMELTLDDASATFDDRTVRSWLDISVVDGAPQLVVNEATLLADLMTAFEGVGSGGEDASFTVEDNQVVILDSVPGTQCCSETSVERVLEALTGSGNRVRVEFADVGRENDRQWAEDLGVAEVIGEFRTFYTDGQSRVTNIKRIAELTQGVLIMPGETFSVNDYVGRRTRDKGFVAAGAIYRGVLVQDVGGGISQYATTLMNAAFFAGLELPEYRAHSIYFSRYPYGREATLAYGAIDLQITNITDHAILLWPSTDSAGITVQLFGTKYAEGEQTGQTSAQVGSSCTRVRTERTRTFVDGREPVVDYFEALYRPEGLLCNGEPSDQ